MNQTDVRQCDWCGLDFSPDQAAPGPYNLISAGKSVCYSCSDKWEEAEIGLHSDKLNCYIDLDGSVTTGTGHILPLSLNDWRERFSWLSFKLRLVTDGVDVFGQKWLCQRLDERGTLCTLTPKR